MTPVQAAPRLLIGPLSAAAGGPLYLQIVDRLKREISEGRLEAGAPLPSFRRLAEDLLVSVITVKRAYEELERDGIIYRRQGLGTFVSDAAGDRSREAKTAHAAALFKQGAREAAEAGLPYKAILQLAETAIRQDADDHSATHTAAHLPGLGAPRHVRKRA